MSTEIKFDDNTDEFKTALSQVKEDFKLRMDSLAQRILDSTGEAQASELKNNVKSQIEAFSQQIFDYADEVETRKMRVFDDGNPTRDDFKVINPDIRFSRNHKKQTLIIHMRQLSKLRNAKIESFYFEDTPSDLIPSIHHRPRGDSNWQPTQGNLPLPGDTDAIKFEFAFPQGGPFVCVRFHFLISAIKRDGTETTLQVDPQVGNDPPGVTSSCAQPHP